MKNLRDYPRIAIIGCPGSGKSTLAREIAETTGHPLIHLDYHYHQPGWIDMPRDEFITMMNQWIQGGRWIIDGHYSGTLELRYAAADLVICLDLPRWLCLRRAVKRQGKQRPDQRPDVSDPGMFTKEFAKFLLWIWRFRKTCLPEINRLREACPGVDFIHLRSRRAVRELEIS